MEINLNNYQAYFLDHLEGRLNPAQEELLLVFLEEHPELKQELDDYKEVFIPADSTSMPAKESLKKQVVPFGAVNEGNINLMLVQEMEGQLDQDEISDLKNFLNANPAYEYDRRIFGLTRLKPDLEIIYPAKQNLKKRSFILINGSFIRTFSAIAAAILIFFALRSVISPSGQRDILPAISQLEPMNIQSINQTLPTASINTRNPAQRQISDIYSDAGKSAVPISHEEIYKRQENIAKMKLLGTAQISNEFGTLAFIPEMRLSTYNNNVSGLDEPKRHSIAGMVIFNFANKAKNIVKGLVAPEKDAMHNMNFWNLADLGLKGYNAISDRNIELFVEKNPSGKVESYSLVEENKILLSKVLNNP